MTLARQGTTLTARLALLVVLLAAAGLLREHLVVGLLAQLGLVLLALVVLGQEAAVELLDVAGLLVVGTAELVVPLERDDEQMESGD